MITAILFTNEREVNGLAFVVNDTSNYKAAYLEVKHKIEDSKTIDHIIEKECLLWDLFKGDTSYKFLKTYWANCCLNFVFENSEFVVKEYHLYPDFIEVI